MCEKTIIRQLNDALRADMSDPSLGLVVLTKSVHALGVCAVQAIIGLVRDFDDFTKDNDPHDEHDFGAFEYGADTIFWKIDYYDIDFRCGSENPASAADTKRVLTIMLASEY